jgi:hypothetical protein
MLTPVPRRKIFLASVIAMLVMDFVTMAVVITEQVWLSFNMVGFDRIWNTVVNAFHGNPSDLLYILWGMLLSIAGYLLVMMIIMLCVTVKKSIFFLKLVSGLLTFLLACVCVYAVSLLQLVLSPFGSVQQNRLFIIITLNGGAALPAYILLTLLEAVALFVFTAKLMERKINI